MTVTGSFSSMPALATATSATLVPCVVPGVVGNYTISLGQIASVLQATPLPIAAGGTGATSATAALFALGGTTLAAVQSQGYVTAAGAATAAPVQSVAGRTGIVTLGSTDLTDATATGRALLTAVNAAGGQAVLGLGTLATQNAVSVAVTGGTIDGVPIGNTSRAAGAFTSLAATQNPTVAGTAVQALGRNLIINGNFRVNQRGYVSGAALAANVYGHDRWKASVSGSYTFTQASVAENTATHSIDTTITLPSGMTITQIIEASVNEGGTFCLSWAGTASGYVNYYDGSGYINALASGASGRSFTLPAGVTVYVVFFGTGTLGTVQLERGAVSTPFERESRADVNRKCQRYYQAFTQGTAVLSGYATAGSTIGFNFLLPVTMRSAPTFAFVGTWNATNVSGSPGQNISSTSVAITLQASATGMVSYNAPASGGFTLDAEL